MKSRQDELRRLFRDRLRSELDYSREISDEEMQELIDGLLVREGKKLSLSLEERIC